MRVAKSAKNGGHGQIDRGVKFAKFAKFEKLAKLAKLAYSRI
jgi:hypothetical protein